MSLSIYFSDSHCTVSYLSEEKYKELTFIANNPPPNIELTFSIKSHNNKIGIKTIYLNVDNWNQDDIDPIENILFRLDNLNISTRTPQHVFPWALKFNNLQSISIEEDINNQAHSWDNVNPVFANFKNLQIIDLSKFTGRNNFQFENYLSRLKDFLSENKLLNNCKIIEN